VQGGLGYSFSFKVKWCYISTKQLESERSKSFPVKIFPKFREIEQKLIKITMRGRGLGYCFSLKVKCGCISAHKLESQRSKSFPVSISLQTKVIRR